MLIALLLLVGSSGLKLHAQQEPMYSQYMFNMLNLNPAYAGNRAVNNITFLHRNQWAGFDGSPKTTTISWDRRAEGSNVGYGVQLYNDKISIENTTGIQAFYSYRLPFENSALTLGLSAGFLNYSAKYSQLTTIDKGDPLFSDDKSTILPTFGFGMLYSAENWYAGFSIPALLKTKSDDSKLQINGANNHYFLNGGYIFRVNEILKLKPSVLFKYVSGAPLEADLNLNAWINDKYGAGISYRTNDAIVAMVEIQITPKIRAGYAFDYTVSKLNDYNNGTHELMLRYEFDAGKIIRILSPRYY